MNDWIKEESLKQSIEEYDKHIGKIFTFGSYQLEVHDPGADIDTLVVGPRHIKREMFFTSLKNKLENHPLVKEFNQVPNAFVPVIKMKFDGVHIDLLYAVLDMDQIPIELVSLDDDNLLKNMTKECI